MLCSLLAAGADADTMQHDQGSQRQPTVTAAATPARAAAATPLKSKAAPAPAPAGAASARPTAKSSTPLKAPAPQALPAAGDEDDDLLAIDMAQLAASIQQSLQQRQAQQAAAKAKAMEQKQKQSSDEEEEGEEDEEEETDAGEQEGAGPSGVEGEQAYEGTIKLHDAAGPSSAGAGDDEMQLVGQRLRLQEWVPQVAVPQGPKSTRLVHQREPVKGEKEQGLAKQVGAHSGCNQCWSGQSWQHTAAGQLEFWLTADLKL